MILTALFDDPTFQRFDAERRRHFPSQWNFIPAHVTLFHALPDPDELALHHLLGQRGRATKPLRATATRLQLFGRGVAYVIESEGLGRFRDAVAVAYKEHLSRQDAQPFKPHVTIQNKVEPETARALLTTLEATFEPFEFTFVGVALWHYRHGPWKLVAEHRFDCGVDL